MRNFFMNICKNLLIGTGLLWSLTLCAENAVVLESFESDINCASLVSNPGGRTGLSPTGVSLSQHAGKNEGDANVTEGNKSLKVVLSGKQGFGFDFQIKLSVE